MLPGSGVLVTPGSGVSLATQLISSKEYEVWMPSDGYGHVHGSTGLWCGAQAGAIFPTGDHNLCALWNGVGSGVELEVMWYQVAMDDSVAGATFDDKNFPRIYRITAQPSAGTTRTPVASRTSMAALPAQVEFYGEGVTATPTGTPFDFRWLSGHASHGQNALHAGAVRPASILPRISERERIVLAQGEGIVVHGGDNNNFAQTGAQALYWMLR